MTNLELACDLDAIEARLNAASPDYAIELIPDDGTHGLFARPVLFVDGGQADDMPDADVEFVGHAPEDVRALVARVRAVEAERDEARAVIAKVRAYAEDRAFRARRHSNTVNSGRIATDLIAIVGDTTPAPVEGVAEGDADPTVETAPETGVSLIAAERVRVVNEEGYDAEHDRGHARELVNAAQVYAMFSEFVIRSGEAPDSYAWAIAPDDYGYSSLWPWHADYWKPTGDPVRDLTKTGGLIAAAIDSLLAEEGSNHA